MNIFLKVMIVFVFLLSIASVVMAWLLFDQREVMKIRVLAHEAHAERMVKELQWADFSVHRDKSRQERYGSWSEESAQNKNNTLEYINDHEFLRHNFSGENFTIPRMEIGLRQMELVARDRVATMISNKTEWDALESRLGETNLVLNNTRVDLANTQSKLADEEDAHSSTRDDLGLAEQKVSMLEGQIIGLKSEITALDEKVSDGRQEIGKLRVELERCYAAALDLREQIEILKNPDGNVVVLEDIIGQVVAVEAEWNFIVINVGKEQSLKENTIAMVHRGDDLIGKIDVTKVGENVSIGQIIGDWAVEGTSIQPGDGVMF